MISNMARFEPKNITADIPIIGFTGALGSGCTFFAESLAENHGYVHYKLSTPIRRAANERSMEKTTPNLQDIGNELRRKDGLDVLVKQMLQEADGKWPAPGTGVHPKGILIDGIKNTAEAKAVKQWPNGFIVSIQADTPQREGRLVGPAPKKFKSSEQFAEADRRDAEERTRFGQQVKRCNHLADMVVINDKFIAERAGESKRTYINEKIYEKYITLIERIASGVCRYEHQPDPDETFMTIAYCESLRSSCLKRQVGAVIVEEDGAVISVAHNDVPEGSDSCLKHEKYEGCARDVIREAAAADIKYCPSCGKLVHIDFKCVACNKAIHKFTKRCPHCDEDPEVIYKCSKCSTDVFDTHLPGGRKGKAGKLLDMCRALHAEETAIISVAKTGIANLRNATIYATTFPCNQCANKIVQAGIGEVVNVFLGHNTSIGLDATAGGNWCIVSQEYQEYV
jgi:deoxycytidylate deaminase